MKKNKGAPHETKVADSERKIFLATSEASLHSYAWDQKLQYAPNIKHISCPFQSTLPAKQVIEALRDNSTIQSISFPNRRWEQKELNELVECLTEYNKGVNMIEFDMLTLTPMITEAWVKILKRNPRIKTVKFKQYYNGIPEEFFARFCDGLEYYNIESLELDTIKSLQQFQILAENLKYSQSLTELSIKNQLLYRDRKLFQEICNVLLESPTISCFRFTTGNVAEDLLKEDYEALSAVINLNKLKHLSLMLHRIEFQHLESALKNSTSVQSLEFMSSQADYKTLGDILATNTNIKKLDLSRSLMTEHSISDLKFSTNTGLEEFSLNSVGSVSGSSLFRDLKSNSTLKSLTFGHSLVFDVVGLQELLKINTSLTELNLPSEIFEDRQSITYIANGLKENTTLRKLTCHLMHHDFEPAMKFIQQMRHNRSLTHLSMGPDLMRIGMINRYGVDEYARVDQLALDLVTTNKNLRYLQGADKFPHIAEQLKKNREEQDSIISNMCILIKMILMKPNSFILPIEVWSNIFKHASYSFVPFDFGKFFKDSMA